MSHYSDAEDSIDDLAIGVRKRQPVWDSDNESIASEIKVCFSTIYIKHTYLITKQYLLKLYDSYYYCYQQDLLDDVADLGEEEDGGGCPLPSTPEDENMLDSEVRKTGSKDIMVIL